MSATRAKRPSEGESTPQVPQSTPQSVGYGTGDYSFTLQAIMELQKSVGEMNATMSGMRTSIDSMKSKVDDLVGWKHKIAGGAAVLGIVFAGLGFLLGKASDYVTIKGPVVAPTPAPLPQPPAAQSTPPPPAR